MIEFNRRVKRVLPYDRKQYGIYLADDFEPNVNWYGVSFQLPGASERREISLTEFIDVYGILFENVITQFDTGSFWTVNHDKKDMDWFPNSENNLTFLRTLFKENNIPNTFRGALVFKKDDLLLYAKDLITYPYSVFDEKGIFYMNLDISHGELPLIIKILDHLNIDFLSTNKELLKKIVNENSSSIFVIKQYRGTSLL